MREVDKTAPPSAAVFDKEIDAMNKATTPENTKKAINVRFKGA